MNWAERVQSAPVPCRLYPDAVRALLIGHHAAPPSASSLAGKPGSADTASSFDFLAESGIFLMQEKGVRGAEIWLRMRTSSLQRFDLFFSTNRPEGLGE